MENPKEKLERELSKPELIHYYYQRLALIQNPHLRANPNTKDFPEVKTDPQKFAAFDLAVELHRAGSCPWVG
ncbi:hypothetical protein H6G80_31365 [Nostoc sp. FACHB-87]|uniref:hypothetical protein n=1 Tax=Nostocales TaxID=1161 RepID=UPI00168423C5|nr:MULTISPECIES: hypothetical protein [Nostocales]MBD2302606.1 hypothetical protein [Nostoc sp. FACHB-190]MBD2458552.1 hypothetical protein [Nostoc sp. FACHB-87]MBD2479632.1 hypothetical protein [Anabaena sp. FACHB-83]MBD2492708.1 hypothetical protein [Aulosira sp. FACHB-615]